jgi:hypothetical protein
VLRSVYGATASKREGCRCLYAFSCDASIIEIPFEKKQVIRIDNHFSSLVFNALHGMREYLLFLYDRKIFIVNPDYIQF